MYVPQKTPTFRYDLIFDERLKLWSKSAGSVVVLRCGESRRHESKATSSTVFCTCGCDLDPDLSLLVKLVRP